MQTANIGANGNHGQRRTNDDKRRAVMQMLDDAEWSGWSSREIAQKCGVSHTFVDNVRPVSGNGCQIDHPRTVTRNGTTYEMHTANIGQRQESDPVPLRALQAAEIETEPSILPNLMRLTTIAGS